MSFQAYLDTIKVKTGKTPDDFIALANEKGLLEPGVKAGQIIAWLKEDFGLGHGHAMAIVNVFKQAAGLHESAEERIAKQFTGTQAAWFKPYDDLMEKLKRFGSDVKTAATDSYISLLCGTKKFGIVEVNVERMDIGIKLKGAEPTGRFKAADGWNAMVTHRVQVTEPNQIDSELLGWLKQAYDKAKGGVV
jgi:predicted transport protein